MLKALDRRSDRSRASAALRLAARDIALAALAGLLIAVAIDAAVSLRPREFSLPTATRYDPYLDDFAVFYAAGELAREGGDNLYDVSAMRAREAAIAGQDVAGTQALPFFNPPHVAIALAPMTLLPPALAAAVWTVATFVLIGAAAALVSVRHGRIALSQTDAVFGGLLLVASMPFYQVIVHGQMTGLLMVAVALLWLGMFRGRSPALVAAALVLLTVKPHLLLLPILLAVYLRMWRALAIAAAVTAVALAIATFAFGPSVMAGYVQLVARAATWDEVNGISIYGMFGWNAFLRGLLGPDFEGARALLSAALVAATAVVAVTAIPRIVQHGAAAPAFFLFLAAMVLASPHFYAHDLLILAPGLVVLRASARPLERTLGLIAVGVLWTVTYFHLDILAATRLNLVVLALAAALCLAAAALTRTRPWLAWRPGSQVPQA